MSKAEEGRDGEINAGDGKLLAAATCSESPLSFTYPFTYDAVAKVGSTHVANDKDSSVELDESATQERRCYLGHPDGHGGENHKGSSASKEPEDQEHSDVLTSGHDSARDEDEECALLSMSGHCNKPALFFPHGNLQRSGLPSYRIYRTTRNCGK